MDRIIVYIDDAAYAAQQLVPMAGGSAAHWVIVACPPRMTKRISKWVSHSARETWRAKWSEKLVAQVAPGLREGGGDVTSVIAEGNLVKLTQSLIARHGAARVLDARRPKFGQDLPPVTADQPPSSNERWEVPGAVAGLGAALLLAAE
ncbi:hypothetical protein [Caenimonas aquaedulcis]|uniref:Uncharacterized protein n=1 Tax=Caenimonas aquaedulcis TaxID=2793270 RepID=A0A931H582_9BURK|nr:hypothetical protein [Caenimonas aquaedulcis]MBG9388869.1 hypothetical protein [Caenimonas aquaedulcis]